MFNFASKVFNTLGDLINVEDPPKPVSNQPQRRSSADGLFFQQPKTRFHGPTSLSDHNSFREQTSSLTRDPRPSVPIYRHPSTSSITNHQQSSSTPNYSPSSSNYGANSTRSYGQSSGSNYSTPAINSNQYRNERYEDAYKTSEGDYDKDTYINRNYDSSERPSYIAEMQKEYGIFENHNEHDMNQRKEEDRYLSNYDNNETKLPTRKSNREIPQGKNTKESNEKNSMYSNSLDLKYHPDSWSGDQNSDSLSYDDQYRLSNSYGAPRNLVNNENRSGFTPSDNSQFTDNLWAEEYRSQPWKNEESGLFEMKDDKISPSPPSQDEDAKNSSRSGSESSDEISFGEALATGLIPPHITPEIAARMNIELINHPKAVIESIYGHSPGEVYTIPEEEDEIYSPTGADGVTSLRKQRMASARMETSNVLKELQNQQRRTVSNQFEGKLKQKYNPAGIMDPKDDQNQHYPSNEPKLSKQAQKYPNMKYQPELPGQPQQFQHQLPQPPFESNMPYQQHRLPENKTQHQLPKVPQNKQPMNYQTDSRFPNQTQPLTFQNYPTDNLQPQQVVSMNNRPIHTVDVHQRQIPLQSDPQGPPELVGNRQLQNQSYDGAFRPVMSGPNQAQGYNDNRMTQTASYCDNRSLQPVHFRDNRQAMVNDGRTIQKGDTNFQTQDSSQPQQYQQQYHRSQPQSLPYPQTQMMDNQSNQFVYPSENRASSQQNFSNDNQQTQSSLGFFNQQYPPDNRPSQSGFPQLNQQQSHYPVSNELWSNQSGVNYSQMQPSTIPNYPSDGNYSHLPQQNAAPNSRQPISQAYSDMRAGPQYYLNPTLQHQNYPQDPRKTNFQQSQQDMQQQMQTNQSVYQQQEYFQPAGPFNASQFPRRTLPSEPETMSPSTYDQQMTNRKRLPLRRYCSEERYSSFQGDFDRSNRRNSQTYENDEMSPQHGYDPRVECDKSRQRSSSLDSQERAKQYSKSRSCSIERNRDLAIEEYEKENRRKMLARTQSQCDEYSHEERRKHMQRASSVDHPGHSGRGNSAEKTRKSGLVQDRLPSKNSAEHKLHLHRQRSQPSQPSLPQVDNLRISENYCPQHKKFTSTKQTRRVLPKEPAVSQREQRKLEKSFSTERSSAVSKAEESARQRAGILTTAAKKSERGANLKITFSDPISNLDPKNKTLSATLSQPRANRLSKSDLLKQDKSTATSNASLITAHHVCPFTRESTNVILGQVSPLHRNQSLDAQFRDGHLIVSPNARSHPIPIVSRTRSLDRYSSSDTNLNASPYYQDHFIRPGSAPGLMYEPVQHQPGNSAALQLSLYEMHALKKEEKFWSDIYSALPADMKHLIANRGSLRNKLPASPAGNQLVERPSSSASLEHRLMQRGMISKGNSKHLRDVNSSLGERIGNRLRVLHEMKEQSRCMANRRKPAEVLARRSASDGEYSFSSTTNFPLYCNLQRRPHSDSAIDLLERLDMPNPPPRMSGSAYNSSEYLTAPPYFRVIDKSQSYLTSPSTNVPPSPAPTQPIKLRDTALRGDRVESSQVNHPAVDNRSGFFSCLQNIESLTRQYQEEDFIRDEDEIYSDSGIPHSDYARYDIHTGRRQNYGPPVRRRKEHF